MTGETITPALRKRLPPLRLKNIMIVAGLFLFIAVAVYFNLYQKDGEPALAVQAAAAEEKDLVKTVFATGRLETADRQEIYVQSSGLLAELKVEAGDRVKAGQVLGRLDTVPLTRRLEEAEANLSAEQAALDKLLRGPPPEELAQERSALVQVEAELAGALQKVERTRLLYEQGAAPKVELEEAERELKIRQAVYDRAAAHMEQFAKGPAAEEVQAARARVAAVQAVVKDAREQQEKAVFRPGADGMVLFCNARAGGYVTTGTLLMVIGDPGNLEINAEIAESDSGELAPGQEAIFTCPALPGKEFKGTVTWVAPAAVKSAGTGQTDGGNTKMAVKIKPAGPADGLRPGYTADLTITTRVARQAVVIPYEAIREENGRKWIYVIQDSRAARREIKTGTGNELFIEVTEGLQKGEKVIVNPPKDLQEGRAVKEKAAEKAGK